MSVSGAPINGPSPSVLVVEDETLIRMLLAMELESAGYRVLEAENADGAIAQLISHPEISAVVTDVRMPGSMDGLGLCAWMHEHRADVPIFITSGFATPPDIAAINPAIVKVVSKPYRAKDVIALLGSIGLNAPIRQGAADQTVT